MAIATELETPTQPSVGSDVNGETKRFKVPTSPVDGKGEVVAFIGPGVEFKGEIHYQGSVQIDGFVEGEIHTNGTLLIGEKAVLQAKVHAGSVISRGKITGDIEAKEKVQFQSKAMMDGSVNTPQLSMESGVIFNGEISMRAGGRASKDISGFKSKTLDPKAEFNRSSAPYHHQDEAPKDFAS
jgi:cytoskeletal protein CcmA (bactofilin family)